MSTPRLCPVRERSDCRKTRPSSPHWSTVTIWPGSPPPWCAPIWTRIWLPRFAAELTFAHAGRAEATGHDHATGARRGRTCTELARPRASGEAVDRGRGDLATGQAPAGAAATVPRALRRDVPVRVDGVPVPAGCPAADRRGRCRGAARRGGARADRAADRGDRCRGAGRPVARAVATLRVERYLGGGHRAAGDHPGDGERTGVAGRPVAGDRTRSRGRPDHQHARLPADLPAATARGDRGPGSGTQRAAARDRRVAA